MGYRNEIGPRRGFRSNQDNCSRGRGRRGLKNGRSGSSDRRENNSNSADSRENHINRGANSMYYLNSPFSNEPPFKREGIQRYRGRDHSQRGREGRGGQSDTRGNNSEEPRQNHITRGSNSMDSLNSPFSNEQRYRGRDHIQRGREGRGGQSDRRENNNSAEPRQNHITRGENSRYFLNSPFSNEPPFKREGIQRYRGRDHSRRGREGRGGQSDRTEKNNNANSRRNHITRVANSMDSLNSNFSNEPTFKGEDIQRCRGKDHNERGREGRGGQKSNFKRENPIGMIALENLLKLNPDEVVLELLSERSGYQIFLDEDEVRDVKMMLLIKVLALASSTNANKKGLNDLLIITCEQKFMDKLNRLSLNVKVKNLDNCKEYFTDLYIFLDAYANIMTTAAIDRLPSVVECCIMILEQLQRTGQVSKDLVKKYEYLKDFLEGESKNWWIQKNDKLKSRHNPRYEEQDQMLPPDDYRTMSVIPTKEDLSSTERPFLRRNIVKGQYTDSHHYLDVQFRLLREDFIQPLRKGVTTYRTQSKSRNMDVRIYKNVSVIGSDIISREMIHYVQLKLPKNFKIENSKRLLYGNLLCFTSDNFESIVFASVVERGSDSRRKDKYAKTESALEKNGVIGVKFETDIKNVDFSKQFLIVESRAYFMAYKHVLKALQEMATDPLPMEPYVVKVTNDNAPPDYLTEESRYDLRVVRDSHMMKKSEKYSLLTLRKYEQREDDVYQIAFSSLKEVFIMRELQYLRSREDLGLDDSQHRALHTALTSEMAIVQGPPGTGKTFLGLKLTQILLHNSEAWKDPDRPTPILVVCFTNHALDQFLEGMTQYTQNIVRVGSRTKSEIIAGFQINELLKKVRRSRQIPGRILDRNNILYNEVQNLEYEVRSWRESLTACRDPKGIIHLELLIKEKVIPETLSYQLRGKEGLKEWLLLAGDHTDITQQMAKLNLNAATAKAATENDSEEEDEDVWQDAQDLMDMEEQDRRINTDEDDDINTATDIGYLKVTYEITLQDIEERQMDMSLRFLRDNNDFEAYMKEQIYKQQFETLKLGLGIKCETDRQLNDLEQYIARHSISIHTLDFPTRWQLYKHWLHILAMKIGEKLTLVEGQYQQRVQALNESKEQEYLFIMRKASVIGMTTTGAAQYNSILKLLAPSIVIIEEAAEILESHVITSMTSKCKHLIMIGDHQQLKPSATVYELAKTYELETSLFERMVKNKIKYETLEYQHRMRPNISKLLVPSIYKELKDHPSVKEYPPVRGVTKDIFFISHQIHERKESDDNNSHENSYEAELLIALCRHLVLQGYGPEDITILTPYSGQFFLLRKLQRQHAVCQGVRISVVDNFQGEENKIILLSLVRSNEEGKAGFLKIDNRVCVALSRAKHGLFITGDMSMLERSSTLWQHVKSDLEKQNSIASTFTLRCENHPDQLTSITTGKDILDKSPEGGCLRPCSGYLPRCGHSCVKSCHMRDMDHENIKCNRPCRKIHCENDHPCPKKCWEECGPCEVIVSKLLLCGHMHDIMCYIDEDDFPCPTIVERVLPNCQHMVQIQCHQDPNKYRCTRPCDTRLDCGHQCRHECHRKKDPDHLEYNCFEKCAKLNVGCSQNHECQKKCYQECGQCIMQIKKMAPCGHEHKNVECHIPESQIECKKKCMKTLSCGHPCPKKCYEECGGCMVKVKKTVPLCNHEITIECQKEPDRKYCKKKCPLSLACGHQCQARCNQICTSECLTPVPTNNICPLKHLIQLPCHLSKTVKGETAWGYCIEPCNKMLECEHQCGGSCGKCLHGRLHQSCNQPCERQLVCGHVCQESCNSDCPPCQDNCQWKCVHSKCRKKCGIPCEPCKVKCTWSCEHHQCHKCCGDVCSRPPCTEACPLLLQCGHPCVGFCGDPCPSLCRICDRRELIDDFMLIGNEEEPDARFVLLEDCGHCIESEGLEGWLSREREEIGMLSCPRCKKTIYNNRRYQDLVLRAYEDVKLVKRKYYQTSQKVQRKDVELIIQDVELLHDFPSEVKQLTESLGVGPFSRGQGKPKQKNLSDNELKLFKFQAQVLKQASTILKQMDDDMNSKLNSRNKSQSQTKRTQKLNDLLKIVLKTVMEQKLVVAPQMVKEVGCELQRLTILPPLWKLETKAANTANQTIIGIINKIQIVMDPTLVFVEELEHKVKNMLKEGEKYVGSLGISENERLMILSAMGLKQGHWYKCPNGHVYCITECGGAMVESKCPECGLNIGGQSHALRRDNAVATEMDGARHAAWSEQNNMANFDMNDL